MKKVLLCFSLFVFTSSSSFPIINCSIYYDDNSRESLTSRCQEEVWIFVSLHCRVNPYVKFMRMTDPAIKHADAIQPIVVEL